MMPTKKQIRDCRGVIAKVSKSRTGLPMEEFRNAIWRKLVHERGLDAVGPWELYETKPMGFWEDKQNCMDNALQYKSIKAWRETSYSPYIAALRNGWLDECTAHMRRQKVPKGYWNRERCIDTAKPFKTALEWRKAENAAYIAALRNNWVNDCTAHMKPSPQKPKGHWDIKANVLASARRYETRSKWQKNAGAVVRAAKKHGWYEEAVAHMAKPWQSRKEGIR